MSARVPAETDMAMNHDDLDLIAGYVREVSRGLQTVANEIDVATMQAREQVSGESIQFPPLTLDQIAWVLDGLKATLDKLDHAIDDLWDAL
jgi:hypothetical protein